MAGRSTLRGADAAQLLPDGCGTGREGGSGAAGSSLACPSALCGALSPCPGSMHGQVLTGACPSLSPEGPTQAPTHGPRHQRCGLEARQGHGLWHRLGGDN